MHVILFLNHQCNLACTYCYNGEKFTAPLSDDLIRKGVDLAFSRGDARISFFGGEPLLEFEKIQKAVSYAKQVAAETGKKLLRFSTTVNGTLLTEAQLQYFVAENFLLVISLDGIQAAHDANRLFTDGNGSYHTVIEKLQLAKRYLPYLTTVSVITPNNVGYLSESFAHIIELGVTRFSFSFDYESDWSPTNLKTYQEQMSKVSEIYTGAFRRGIELDFTSFTSKINSYLNDGFRVKCRFGEGEITLAPSGRLYPCERLVGEDNNDMLCIGTIDEGVDLQKVMRFKSARHHKDVDCEQCAIEKRCIHFCGCVNYATTGTIGDVSSLLCEVEQTVIAAADRAAATLFTEQNPTFIKKFYSQIASQ